MNDFHFAIVVGIDFYPGIRNLGAARGDAQAVHDWLCDPAGGNLPAANVSLILEAGPFATAEDALPTRERVEQAFRRTHLAARAAFQANPVNWTGSRLYVYFSGHGLANNNSEVAFLMANATLDQPGLSIACGQYMAYYAASQDFNELVFFTDCCRSEMTDATLSGPPFLPDRKNFGAVASSLGFATQYKSQAYEPKDPGDGDRGYYTRALLEGLTGSAADATGEINTTTLANYLRARVQSLTSNLRSPQTPAMLGDPGYGIVFKRGAARPTHPVAIAFPPGFQGDVTLLDGTSTEIDHYTVNGAPWQVALTDGLYEVRSAVIPAVAFAGAGLFKVMGEAANVRL